MMTFNVTKRASHHVSQNSCKNYTRMHLPLLGHFSIRGLQGGEMLYGVGRPAALTVSGRGVNLNNLVQISVFLWATIASLSPLEIMNCTPSTCDDDVGSIPITLFPYKWCWMTVSSGSQSFFYSILFLKKRLLKEERPCHPFHSAPFPCIYKYRPCDLTMRAEMGGDSLLLLFSKKR